MTDLELSTVLGEHDAGQLSPFGCLLDWHIPALVPLSRIKKPTGDIEQVRRNNPSRDGDGFRALPAYWFSQCYKQQWKTEQFLRNLVKVGLA